MVTVHPTASLRQRLPSTAAVLDGANLVVHPAVYRVVLSGSRGLRGGHRPDSDIDLSLLVDRQALGAGPGEAAEAAALRGLLELTLRAWRSPVALDTIAVVDLRGCGLGCFACESGAERRCPERGVDCMGLFKIQKGFDGWVRGAGVDIERVYPMIAVYERAV